MPRLLRCPYNHAHQIKPERMQYHLIKCKKSYPYADMVICPYNATHHIPRDDEVEHLRTCEDRRIVELQRYRYNEPAPGEHGMLVTPVVYNSQFVRYEDEDEETNLNTSFASSARPSTRGRGKLQDVTTESLGPRECRPGREDLDSCSEIDPFKSDVMTFASKKPARVDASQSQRIKSSMRRPSEVKTDNIHADVLNVPLRRPVEVNPCGRGDMSSLRKPVILESGRDRVERGDVSPLRRPIVKAVHASGDDDDRKSLNSSFASSIGVGRGRGRGRLLAQILNNK